MSNKQVRHILGLSGGNDSKSAILMHKQVPQMEYFFCDTHKELPEIDDIWIDHSSPGNQNRNLER